MKKFIAIFDGLKYSGSTEAYAIRLAKDEGAYLVGLFLDDFTYHSYVLELTDYRQMLAKRSESYEKDKKERLAATQIFKQACQKARVDYAIHHDQSIASQELLHESIYADLLIIDKELTFSKNKEIVPGSFIRQALANAECPALVVSPKFRSVEKIILLFDGGPASVYAIKQFSYIFPSLKGFPVEVLCVKAPGLNRHLPENRLMKDFMKRHFPNAAYTTLQGDPETEIVQYLKNRRQNELLVLGAYERHALSRWFKPSMADRLLMQLKTPLFIAHR